MFRTLMNDIDAALDRALLAWTDMARGDMEAATRKINAKPVTPNKEAP